MRKKTCLLLSFLLLTSGCNMSIEPAKTSGHYATQTASSAMEYSLFMNKQLTICSSHMMSRITAIKNMEQSTCEAELASAKESYSVLEEVRDTITTTMPAKTYESTRDTSLIVVDAAMQDMKKYIKYLEEQKDVSSFTQLFQNDFNELTSQCNLYNN